MLLIHLLDSYLVQLHVFIQPRAHVVFLILLKHLQICNRSYVKAVFELKHRLIYIYAQMSDIQCELRPCME